MGCKMNIVILCAKIWIAYASMTDAKKDIYTYSSAYYEESCIGPFEATEDQLAYYSSHEFKPFKSNSLYAVSLNQEAAKVDAEEENREEKIESKTLIYSEENKTLSNPVVNHCRYDMVKINSQTFKMVKTKCWYENE